MTVTGTESKSQGFLDRPGAALIADAEEGGDLVFEAPEEVICATRHGEVAGALSRLEERLREGRWAAGYIAYDAGLRLDKVIRSRHQCGVPLMWLRFRRNCF